MDKPIFDFFPLQTLFNGQKLSYCDSEIVYSLQMRDPSQKVPDFIGIKDNKAI